MEEKKRCNWCGDHPIYLDYHDREWGIPITDDQKLFEFLTLEGAQAGLNWFLILKKREFYRKLFDQFDIDQVANYDAGKIQQLLQDPRIVRNRLKLESAVKNARAIKEIQAEYPSWSDYLWRFVNHRPIQNCFTHIDQIPAQTEVSNKISCDLKKRGFSFVGGTICYSFMQAVGMVNDHLVDCFRYREIQKIYSHVS